MKETPRRARVKLPRRDPLQRYFKGIGTWMNMEMEMEKNIFYQKGLNAKALCSSRNNNNNNIQRGS